MILVDKPKTKDLKTIEKILSQWTDKDEADKYTNRITNEIDGIVEFNMRFWVARENDEVLGVTGFADPLPKVLPLSKTKKPVEMKILYIDSQHQGKGIGRLLVSFIENEAKKQDYMEVLVRSAERYKDTAWGFYDRLGYEKLGTIPGGEKSKIMQVFGKKL